MATFADLIAQHRTHVDRVLTDIARVHHLSAEELSEFAVVVERALERNDYELLRAFEGRSTWETYLTTAIRTEFIKFQQQLWGQWRPSASAQGLGPTAMLLEELVARDGLPLDDAIDVMRRTHHVDVPRHRLEQLYRALRQGGVDPTADAHDHTPEQQRKRAIEHAVADAFALLSPDDRLALVLRYQDGQPLTRIARLLREDPRPLQRRIERAKEVLHTSLVTQGITAEEIEKILKREEAGEPIGRFRRWCQAVFLRPSNH